MEKICLVICLIMANILIPIGIIGLPLMLSIDKIFKLVKKSKYKEIAKRFEFDLEMGVFKGIKSYEKRDDIVYRNELYLFDLKELSDEIETLCIVRSIVQSIKFIKENKNDKIPVGEDLLLIHRENYSSILNSSIERIDELIQCKRELADQVQLRLDLERRLDELQSKNNNSTKRGRKKKDENELNNDSNISSIEEEVKSDS